jgi:lysophospholipase L1-like esterase
VKLGKETIATIGTTGTEASLVEKLELPEGKKKDLEIVAQDKGAKIYGLSFETGVPGVIYEPIGPLGGDAKLYLQFGRKSFREHLALHAPDLVVLMVGGNDAMKVRRGWTTMDQIRADHVELIKLLREIVPNVECLLWSPMDAGEKEKGKVVSRTLIRETREMQAQIASEMGCAFWDMYEAMGGDGSIARWSKANVMNADLVHPRAPAADLLGDLFADAWLAELDGGAK